MSRLFNIQSYYSYLRTKRIGRPCIYLDQVETTIDVAAHEPPDTIVLAKKQLKGIGQRNNVWHSPVGCAMGSVRLVCRKESPLGTRLCFLQHIFALIAAKTLERIDDNKLSKHKIRLKWPNDIIYADGLNPVMKLGGILVHTTEQGSDYDVILSFGLNVFNSEPTTCIQDIVGQSRNDFGIDSIVAEMMNSLEQYSYELDDDKFQQMKFEYAERCIQMNKIVEDETNGRVKVKEVNDDGFLAGERCDDMRWCTITKIL